RRYNPFRGEVFLSYIVLYSVGRFFIEGMRTDSLYFGFLRQAQLLSLVLIIGAVILIIYRRKIDRKSTRLNSSHVSISYAVFSLNHTSTSQIYTLFLHDALPI